MSDVIDISKYKELKNKVSELVQKDTNSLTLEQSSTMIHLLANLVKQQSAVLEATLETVSLLTNKQALLEDEFTWVSCQAYMAIKIIQDKNICTKEEIEAEWEKLVREKIRKEETSTEG